MLLILYPMKGFKLCLEKCRFRHWHSLAIVMDVFQGWFKDGTKRTLDYRTMSALYMLLRVGFSCEFVLNYFFGNGSAFQWIVPSLVHVGIGCFFLTVKPYKQNWMNIVDGLMMTLLGMMCALCAIEGALGVVFAMILLPTVVFLLYIFWKGYLRCLPYLKRLFHKFNSLKCGRGNQVVPLCTWIL